MIFNAVMFGESGSNIHDMVGSDDGCVDQLGVPYC